MNNLYRKLKLPFDVATPGFPMPYNMVESASDFTMFRYDCSGVDFRFTELIASLGLTLFWTDIFYTPPHQRVPIHLDETYMFSDMIKINIHVGSSDSVISWYDLLLDSSERTTTKTQTGTDTVTYQYHELDLIHSQCIDNISFMNASIPHGFVNNTATPSWILSMAIHKDGTNLKFKEALELFKDYIEE